MEEQQAAAAPSGPGQLALLPPLEHARREAASATARTTAKDKARAVPEPAPERPVARVLVDVPLAHLDRPFDYLVPASMHDDVVVGCRVKVRFAGQDVGGYVVERAETSDHPGTLAPLRRAVSAEPVLAPAVARLSGLVAERYAGTRADVLRLAVPPRHAATERRPSPPAAQPELDLAAAGERWAPYDGDVVRRLAAGESPRWVCSALPRADWPELLAAAAAATLASGRGALLCVPDQRDLARLDAALTATLGTGQHVLLAADVGPAARYRAFLAVARGAVRVVAGTRAAAFAPVHDLGLVAMWDDGDDLYAEPRAPYPHTREVLLLRAHEEGAAALLAAYSRTVEAAQLVVTGWAAPVSAPRSDVRAAAPRVAVAGGTDRELARDPFARSARVPGAVHELLRECLALGPVLVQTPRQGYAASLACAACRSPARCGHCAGPLTVSGAEEPPTCGWCARPAPQWACPVCGADTMRAPVLGDRRTAEELGRAFPGVAVRRSAGDRVIDSVGEQPAIVVATPGAEPRAEGGYAGAVLLDTWVMLSRLDLRTGEESLRRWLNAVALVRRDGRVVAVGDPADPVLQALVRWDPVGFAERELAARAEAHLPPTCRLATLTGDPEAVAELLAELVLPPATEVLGPAPVADGQVRAVVRAPRVSAAALSRALLAGQGVRAARKRAMVRVQVDPVALT